MQIPTVITKTADLEAFVAKASNEPFITIDTEFIRERTYFAQLCLLQVATAEEAVAIDPLAEGMDLSSLYTLLLNEKVMKVFHACRQDLEIFYHAIGEMPKNVYDTQIAAMVCGYGESVGYEKLVNALVGASLDKASRFTDWARRPLSDRQLHYALDDVTHLRVVFAKLRERIEKDGRTGWIEEDMAELTDPSRYRTNPFEAYKRLRVKSRAPEYLQLLRAVAAWRESMAVEKNVPVQRIMRDELALQVAAMKPESEDDLREVRGINHQVSRENMRELVEVLMQARMAPRETWPEPGARPQGLTPSQDSCCELLRMLLKQRCDEAHIVPRLLASRDELEEVIRGDVALADAHFMHGWRYEVFGKDAEAFLSGKLAVSALQRGKGYAVQWQAVTA